MTPTGATLSTPADIISPSCGAAPATSAAAVGIRMDATSTETRFDSTATRNIVMVMNPSHAISEIQSHVAGARPTILSAGELASEFLRPECGQLRLGWRQDEEYPTKRGHVAWRRAI